MKLKTAIAAAAVPLTMALPVWAGSIEITEAYARAASPLAKAGAAFMEIANTGETPDRLIAAATESAKRVELHTHIITDGIAQMREVEGGFAIAPDETIALARGGDHVMMMGLTHPFTDGDTITLTLTFEIAGDMEIEVPVDLQRE